MKAWSVVSVFASLVVVAPVWAQQRADAPPPPRLTPAQMAAVHDCAAAKGVELPPPPPSGGDGPSPGTGLTPPSPPDGMAPPPDGKGPPPGGPDNGSGGPRPMRLTDAQRQIVDACFAANGLQPPPNR